MPLPRAGAGCSPRRARHFSLLRQRKVPKRKATPSLRPLRCAKGQTCGGAVAGCAVELTALRCSFVQTSTASQLTKRVCPAAHPPPRALRAPGASRRGGEQTAIRAVAALGLAVAARSACVLGAERSEGPWGCSDVWAVQPHLAAPAAGWLRGGMRVGARMLRQLTRRGCLNAAAKQRSEFHGAPRTRAPQVAGYWGQTPISLRCAAPHPPGEPKAR